MTNGRHNNYNRISHAGTMCKQIALWRVFALGQDVSESRADVHAEVGGYLQYGKMMFPVSEALCSTLGTDVGYGRHTQRPEYGAEQTNGKHHGATP